LNSPLSILIQIAIESRKGISKMVTFDNLDLTDRYNLIKSLPKHYRVGVEIGVWQGWYTEYLIKDTNMHIFGIDPFCETDSYSSPEKWDIDKNKDDFDPFNLGNDGFVYPEARYMVTINRMNKVCGKNNRLTIIRDYSYNVKYFFDGGDLDFVYIDGEHTYDAVRQDMDDWWSKIKIGGILAGHDYHDTQPGTVQAVDEFVKKFNLEFKLTGTNEEKGDAGVPSWVITKTKEHEE